MIITTLILALFYSGILAIPTIQPESWSNDTRTVATCESCSVHGHKSGNASASATDAGSGASESSESSEWTIRRLQRKCYKNNQICVWKFGIDCGHDRVTKCYFVVNSLGRNKTATETDSPDHVCGRFTVSSGWSGQFGPGNGFSVLALVDNESQLIAWPSYSDKQIQNGTVVKPDQTYTPKKLKGTDKGGRREDEQSEDEEEGEGSPTSVNSGGW
ncbi:hypothetical protein PFICI_13781 [Pestalotiopsis fici W106-1]|uniref:Secreted protein n=1 Tax=Pestalotiopsis fici (strain W106-1 / CGMCC3.15140) TaxID=1229662 RepID=W3WJ07_PESFW|nr:uncharacterized protein PFICI_13781 [Pestalotiopsis fici W106-1]ETS73915.1 hypothetical protein PFICI_13781 [Pestalotiopsis fici W106-1]